MPNTLLLNDWHPVADSSKLVPGITLATTLLDHEVVLWRSSDGTVHAWEDRCPHRGTRLSIGQIENDQLVCRYHGWRYTGIVEEAGRCVWIPAQPDQNIPDKARAKVYSACERYGLIWVCVGQAGQDVLPFPEYADPQLRKVLCGPYTVATSGPRIVENFLDMAHFGFVHTGILGDATHTEVPDYKLQSFDDGQGGSGILATGCFAWQPQTNSLAHGGSMVEYTYRVVRPLTAILTKIPEAQDGFREAISLHVQPVSEENSIVWMVLALTNFVQPEEELRSFQDRIFLQDQPILENQVPKRLPLKPGAELPIRCDRMSVEYRRYLRNKGMSYGVVTE